jgi:hypothetical protein
MTECISNSLQSNPMTYVAVKTVASQRVITWSSAGRRLLYSQHQHLLLHANPWSLSYVCVLLLSSCRATYTYQRLVGQEFARRTGAEFSETAMLWSGRVYLCQILGGSVVCWIRACRSRNVEFYNFFISSALSFSLFHLPESRFIYI